MLLIIDNVFFFSIRYALVDFGLATGAFLIDRESENIGRSVSSAKSKVSATNSAPSLNADARIPLSPSKREADVNLVNAEKPKRGGGARNKVCVLVLIS